MSISRLLFVVYYTPNPNSRESDPTLRIVRIIIQSSRSLVLCTTHSCSQITRVRTERTPLGLEVDRLRPSLALAVRVLVQTRQRRRHVRLRRAGPEELCERERLSAFTLCQEERSRERTHRRRMRRVARRSCRGFPVRSAPPKAGAGRRERAWPPQP
jgi:hypothetical protein